MSVYQITCITKPNVLARDERITHVGGPAWPSPIEVSTVLAMMQLGDKFYVEVDGHQVEVLAVGGLLGNHYIRTSRDLRVEDNLLSLPQCSAGNRLTGLLGRF